MVAVERPFFVTLVFPDLDDPDFPRALELARQSPDFVRGADDRYRAGFRAGDANRLSEVFAVVGRSVDTDVLVDDQSVPYGSSLWIPLVNLFSVS
jgi:hypothetical protein